MRLPALTELTPRQREISDAIAAKRGVTRGPFLIWLRSPELAAKVDALGAYCRFESGINERLRELALLVAARHFDARYSWNAHHGKAIATGVSAESLKELAGNEVPHFAHADEQLLYALATQVLRDHFVAQDLAGEGVEELLVGVREVRDLVAGEFLDRLGRNAGLDRLLVVGIPRVLRVEVAGGDQQRQLTEALVDGCVEPAVGTERVDLLRQLGGAQPDQERPAGGAALGRDGVTDLLLARGELGKGGQAHGCSLSVASISLFKHILAAPALTSTNAKDARQAGRSGAAPL